MNALPARVLKALALLAALAASAAAAAPPTAEKEAPYGPGNVPAQVRSALQDRNYAAAVVELDRLIASGKEGTDYLVYLKGLALAYAKEYDRAIAAFQDVEKRFPKGEWLAKARFGQAEAHLAKREYAAAEAIYEAEARRLMDPARKDDLARRVVALADKYATPKDPDKPDSPEPDFGRAHNLYKAALELEIGRDLRDDVLFKLGRTMQAAKNWGPAISDYAAYLVASDPEWEAGGTKVEARGTHVLEARFALGECYHQEKNLTSARRFWQDLVPLAKREADGLRQSLQVRRMTAERRAALEARLAQVEDLRADAMARIPGTYNAGDRDQALLAIKALRDFLAAFPEGERAVQAAFDIGAVFEKMPQKRSSPGDVTAELEELFGLEPAGRPEAGGIGWQDAAAAAYRDFLAGKGFKAAGDKAQALLAKLTMEATYRLGSVYLAQKKYDEAKAAWNEYVAKYPAGPHWSAAQQGIIEAEYRVGGDLRNQQKFEAAGEAWEAFLQRHPLDARARQIMFDLGDMVRQEAEDVKDDAPDAAARRQALWHKAVARWERLVSKYPGTDESSRAQLMIGEALEMHLKDLERAIKEYRKLTWGPHASRAAERINRMTEKHLTLRTERTWRTGEPACVKVMVRNVETLTVDLFRLDLEDYFRKTHAVTGVEGLDIQLIAPDKTWEVKVAEYARYKPIEQAIEVPVEGARPAVFAVRVTGEKLQATTLLLRSDLDIIVKSSRKALLVFAENMRSEQPWPGATVLVSDGKKVFFEGKTGPDGVLLKNLPELKDAGAVSVFAVADGHVASNALSVGGLSFSEGLSPKGYVYTDRPAYRPGQTVHVRGILREVEKGSYAFQEGRKYVLEVVDSQGRVLAAEDLALGEFGTLHHALALDPLSPLGTYTVRCRRPNGPTFSGTFEVQAYRLERMELIIETARKIVFRGEPLEGTIQARTYYGEPVADREVAYWLPDGRRRTARTDAAGRVAFTFDTRPLRDEQTMEVRAELVGEDVRAREAAFCAVRAFAASVSLVREVVLSGEPFDAAVSTRDVEAKPTGQAMTLKVLRRESQPDGTWAEVLVEEKPAPTDPKSGRASVRLAIEKGGTYVLRAAGTDRFGNLIAADAGLFVSGAEDAVKLRLLADRQRLKVGEQAAVALHSRLKPTLALLTFEGEEIIAYKTVRLAEGKTDIPIAVGHEHFPNFALAAAAMVGNKFFAARTDFTVERELAVTLKPDKAEYRPGGKAAVRVTASDQNGRPVAAELALALVDEALLARFGRISAPVRTFFEEGARREAALRTTTSCTFRYDPRTTAVSEALLAEGERLQVAARQEAGRVQVLHEAQQMVAADDAIRALGEESYLRYPDAATWETLSAQRGAQTISAAAPLRELRVMRGYYADVGGGGRAADLAEPGAGPPPREAFPETAYWNPSVVTGKDGKATVTIDLPGTATRWRLLGIGTTAETLVGEADESLVTKQDFFVELKLPSVVTEGDAVRILARIHNLTDSKGTADLRLRLAAGAEKATPAARIEVPGRGIVEHTFEAWKVPEAEALKVEAEAHLGDAADALVRTVPIRPWGLELAASRSGTVADQETLWLALPEGHQYGRLALSVRVDPGLEAWLVDVALRRRPPAWGCRLEPMPTLASTASDLLGAVSAMRYLQDLGRKDAPQWKLLADRAEGLIASLAVAQRSDGSWAWAGSDNADSFASSRAVWALGEARRLGLAMPGGVLDKGIQCLKNAFNKADLDDREQKAVLLHALAVVNEADFGYANRLYRLRQQLSPSALVHTALALALVDRRPMADEVLEVLESKREALKDEFAGQVRWPTAENQAWMRADDEMAAMALLGYLAARPDSPTVKATADYLLAHQPWSSPRASGPALAALAQWFGRTKPDRTACRVLVRVNDKDVRTLDLGADAPGETISVAPNLLVQGRNRVDLRLEGRGRPAYVAVLAGFARDLKPEGEPSSRFFVRHRLYKAPPPLYDGRPVPVGFAVLTPPYAIYVNKVSELPVGRVTEVELSVERRYTTKTPEGDDDFLVVTEPLPAGTTVLEGSVSGGFDYWRPGDGTITFYVGRRRGIGLIRYTLVGYAPGAYRVLPTVVTSVYSPGLMAIGAPADLKVLARGETSKDPYRPTPDELYHLGRAHFNAGNLAAARPLLEQLWNEWQARLDEPAHREAARMLLMASIEAADTKRIVQYFEVIKEKYPDLVVPFDKVLAVGRAYRQMEEFERAMLVFKATAAASFVKDAHVGGRLEQEGQVLGSVAFMKDLLREYPDTPETTGALLALADTLYRAAPKAGEIKELKDLKVTHDQVMLQAIRVLVHYLTHWPESPTADEAALNLVNAYLRLRDYPSVVSLSRDLRRRFPKSRFFDSFEYVEALALWNLGQYDPAIGLATKVADSTYTLPDGTTKPSDNKALATYIVGQIWHARGRPAKAIEFYGKVKTAYADAAEAIEYFERPKLDLEEVATFEPGKAAAVTVKYRNVPEVHLLIYKVDLMTLYLAEKNLQRITKVRLAGIHPVLAPLTVRLGDGKDYADKERQVPLRLDASGAYLVIARGGDLHASGLVLVTPMKLEVQEDAASGRVRVNVLDRAGGKYLRGVHVKVVGSANDDFRAGETDLRGIFVADGVRGTATVIARDSKGDFAFYRGQTALGKVEKRGVPAPATVDYLENISTSNTTLQDARLGGQMKLYKQSAKGVQVEMMMH